MLEANPDIRINYNPDGLIFGISFGSYFLNDFDDFFTIWESDSQIVKNRQRRAVIEYLKTL